MKKILFLYIFEKVKIGQISNVGKLKKRTMAEIEKSENLIVELKKEILKKAVIYEKENPAKKIVPYKGKIIPKG